MKNERVIKMRKKMNLSQEELAAMTDCSQSMIALIESGKREPKKRIKMMLAEVFKVPVEWLFYEKINDQESLERVG